MADRTTLNVFLATPGDVKRVREEFPKILHRISSRLATKLNPLIWEQVTRGLGRAQARINERLATADLVVVVFGKAWGSPTGEYSCGTEEELFEAISMKRRTGSPDMLLYFRRDLRANSCPDAERIIKLKTWIEKNYVAFYYCYETDQDLIEAVERDVESWATESADSHCAGNQFQASYGFEKRLLEAAQRQSRQATTLASKGDSASARDLFRSACETAEHPEILNQFGAFLLSQGQTEEAGKVFEHALRLSRKESSEWLNSRCNLAKLDVLAGRMPTAASAFAECLELAQRIGRPSSLGRIHQCLMEISVQQGRIAEAQRSAKAASDAFLLAGNLLELAGVLLDMGVWLIEANRGDLAREYLDVALEHATQLRARDIKAKVLINIGRTHFEAKEYDRACSRLDEAISIAREDGLRSVVAAGLSQMAHVKMQMDRVPEAANLFGEALTMEEEIGNLYGMGHDHFWLGMILGAAGRVQEAIEHAKKAVKCQETIGHPGRIATTRKLLEGLLRTAAGDR